MAGGGGRVTPEARRARAYAAQALLKDETLQGGWTDIEAELIAEWSKPQPWDDDRAKARREGLYVELQMLRRLRQKLASFAGQARD